MVYIECVFRKKFMKRNLFNDGKDVKNIYYFKLVRLKFVDENLLVGVKRVS